MKDNASRVFPLSGISVVFDLDGTIADTAGDLIDATNAALLSAGFPAADAEAIKKGVGYGTRAMIRAALQAIGSDADGPQMETLAARLLAHYTANIARKTRLFPRARETALSLKAQGAKVLLCTNKREALARQLLFALDAEALFDAIAGGDSFPFCKPDPRHIIELVHRAGGDLSRALMVGDSEADVAAAKGAGIPIVAVRFGYAAVSAEELGADMVMDDFGELVSLVETFAVERQFL